MIRYLLSCLFLFLPMLSYAQCDVVAVVFATKICQAEISIQNSRAGAKPIPPERQKKIEMNRLAHKIRTVAAQHLLAKESYTPSEAEVNSYAAFMEKAKKNRARQNKEVLETIEHLLKTYQYAEVHRKRLEETLAVFRRSAEQSKQIEEGDRLRDEDMRKRFGEDAVKQLYVRLKQSRHRQNQQWVARWKMNKALYEKYGGRVIFQQAGIEPVDAYRAQLKDIREKGGLQILKPAYKDVFLDFERYLDMGHNYLNDNGDKYFDRPYWQTTDLDENHQRTINDLKRIPHK